ncbi:MAG: hypothetical protein KF883_04055 [Thermomicrobiales bacterium]|nr:hypothetical protein [Thermomicrobiales bacterium]
MTVQDIPLWLLFILTALLVMGAIELGYRVGWTTRRRSEDEKEAPVGAIVGSVLALLAFMLAFTFGTVSDRYDARKVLVREQAASIRTAYLRSDFLPESQRAEAKSLYLDYIDQVLAAGDPSNFDNLESSIADLLVTQQQLWDMAVENVRNGDNSDIAAMYVESINGMMNVLAERVAVAGQARMPSGLWMALYLLVLFGMFAVGYQTANAASRRTWMMLVLALSFSLVVMMIAALDAPQRGYLPVSQRPLTDLQASMNAE